MTKKPDLPSQGGSYVRDSKGLKQVQEPTRELSRSELQKAAETPVKDASKETKK